jgi:hypothetical protein
MGEPAQRHEDRDGRDGEYDVILLHHNGMYVLELKGWHGRITGSIGAPWVGHLRFGRKAAGYHGGASAAEVTIPLLVFAGRDVDLSEAGWQPTGDQAPRWWQPDAAVRSVLRVASVDAKGRRGQIRPASTSAARPSRQNRSTPRLTDRPVASRSTCA